jgi:hypothetical protein
MRWPQSPKPCQSSHLKKTQKKKPKEILTPKKGWRLSANGLCSKSRNSKERHWPSSRIFCLVFRVTTYRVQLVIIIIITK